MPNMHQCIVVGECESLKSRLAFTGEWLQGSVRQLQIFLAWSFAILEVIGTPCPLPHGIAGSAQGVMVRSAKGGSSNGRHLPPTGTPLCSCRSHDV